MAEDCRPPPRASEDFAEIARCLREIEREKAEALNRKAVE